MVMVDEPTLQANRLATLALLKAEILKLADFSLIKVK
jgi:glycyl-tRNA synthetase beta subunit